VWDVKEIVALLDAEEPAAIEYRIGGPEAKATRGGPRSDESQYLPV
jgi:hypothetical protein